MKRTCRIVMIAITLATYAAAVADPPLLTVTVEPRELRWMLEEGQAADKIGTLPPIKVDIGKAVPGESVYVELLRDCVGNGLPDRKDYGSCKSPIKGWTTEPSDTNGHVTIPVDLTEEAQVLPKNIGLWFRISRYPEEHSATLVSFSLVHDA